MYDLIIIGGGPAGYYAAEKAGKAGMSVLLIEKAQIGGVCLNEGCIPSKTLLYCVNLYSSAKASEKFGVHAAGVSFDFAAVMARKKKTVETLRHGIAFTLRKNKVEICAGSARILGEGNGVFKIAADNKAFEAKRLLVCTGSEAVRLPIPGGDLPFVMTNREILSVTSLPATLTVIGGGAIGLELATFFAEAGSRVSVVEMLPHIGGQLDREIGLALKREMEKKGVTFYLQSHLTAIGDHSVTFETEGASQTVPADIILLSVGRKPLVADLGLEALGVATEKGAIKTDGSGRTNVDGVWAAGDVNGVSMLAHTAYREAQVCVENMLGKNSSVNYGAIPSVIYTHPETASVGLTKDEAEARGIAVVEMKLPNTFSGRYLAETDGERGMTKAVVDATNKSLLGVHMLGGHCSEMIFGAAAMIEHKMTVEDISRIVFPHPTVSEIIKDTILQLG
jgi:dihydrolipoamide dehydrogenase